MQQPEIVLASLAKLGEGGKTLDRCYRLLYNPMLYLKAYGKIYRNDGATTPGTTTETVDAMSEGKIQRIISLMQAEKWRWKPVRRVEIPKANGKTRPLGIPSWSDKLIQEVMRLILEAYYEPQFSDHSHGFRPQRGCHTALEEIQGKWTGVKWFIEGDIRGCFDNINHDKLIDILGEKIRDNRFLRLVRNILEAGYMEDWRFNASYSGTPQGGIISPILSNVYLDKLDRYVTDVLIPKYTRGIERRRNKEYESLINRANYYQRKGHAETARLARQKARKLPSADPDDPNFRRLKYIRYADDFLLGYIGPKEEAEAIKNELREFLANELKLEMSQEKTLVTHAREGARFLGYQVVAQHADDQLARDRRRHVNGKIGLRVPGDVLRKYETKYQRKGKALRKTTLLGNTDYEIIRNYNDVFRGVYEYYKLAWNVSQLSKLKWAMERSLVATLAGKHKLSAKQVYRKYRKDIKGTKALVKEVPREGREPLVATWGLIQPKRATGTLHDVLVTDRVQRRSELEKRLVARACELCGSTASIEVHYIRKLKDLLKRRDLRPWEKWMAAKKRKTLVVCKKCHVDIHAGRLQKAAVARTTGPS